jgi:hypothetical protein
MPITFRCHNCHNEVTAPDSAAGRKGKCPFCGHAGEIPAPVREEDLIPMAPLDEEEERLAEAEVRSLLEQEKELLGETGGPAPVPLEFRGEIAAADLHHFVVTYCLDMADGKLHRAEMHAEKLGEYVPLAGQAVEDFISGTAMEPALDPIPRPVLQGFLRELKDRVSG